MPADVLLLGGTGMFGSMAAKVLRERFAVAVTSRRSGDAVIPFDAAQREDGLVLLARQLNPNALIVNAIAVLSSGIGPGEAAREHALFVNGVFPHCVARVAAEFGFRVVQISTDAVFGATAGVVTEADPIGPDDYYGVTKAAGELSDDHCLTIRCSIIGPPSGDDARGLWAWVGNQAPNATIKGFENHLWSGVTTRELADICAALVDPSQFADARARAAIHHFAPNPVLSKFELVGMLARLLRPDISVESAHADRSVDRVLKSKVAFLDRLTPRYAGWNDALAAAA
jgi:dTDP-4-dehydrorhamnose reductase